MLFYFTFIILFAQSTFASGPAFESYSKFILGGQHAGYAVQRFTIDDAKKQMTSTYYAYVKTPTGSTTESLVAKSDLNFEPISYQYSALVDGKGKSVDAVFKNKKMTAKMTDGKKSQTVILNVPPNGFMSTFLNYVMLKNGLSVGKGYEYYALTEEAPACFKGDVNCRPAEAGFIKGTAAIKSEQKYKDVDVYKVDFKFKAIPFTGLISKNGEALSSISPLQDASTETVVTKEEAVANFPFNEKHIRAIFGDIPAGTKNSVVEKITTIVKVTESSAPTPPTDSTHPTTLSTQSPEPSTSPQEKKQENK
jgi:hypothetical protein